MTIIAYSSVSDNAEKSIIIPFEKWSVFGWPSLSISCHCRTFAVPPILGMSSAIVTLLRLVGANSPSECPWGAHENSQLISSETWPRPFHLHLVSYEEEANGRFDFAAFKHTMRSKETIKSSIHRKAI